MGWSTTDKKKEMKHPAMRFLTLRRSCSIQTQTSKEEKYIEQEQTQAVAGNREEGNEQWEDECEPEDGGEGGVLGFLSFMVTEEAGDEVIYWWVPVICTSSADE